MDEKEKDLQEEIEETAEDDGVTDPEEEADETEENLEEEFDFELDEDGNVIIPDDTENSEKESDPEAETAASAEPNKEAEEAEDKLDAFREKAARTESDYEALVSQVHDTLKKLGIDAEDPLKGLAQVAADAEGVPLEEYLEKRAEEFSAEREKKQSDARKYEEMAAADLAELKGAYPELRGYKSLVDMPRDVLTKFARFRDRGFSAKEAYSAANPDGIRAAAAEAAKASAKVDNKSHLKSVVPKGANTTTKTIPKEEIESWMEDLGVSREEAIRLYLKTKKN